MDKQVHPTFYNEYDYFSMLGLKLIHVNKGAPDDIPASHSTSPENHFNMHRLGMDKQLLSTFYNECDNLSMLGFKSIHVNNIVREQLQYE